MCTYRNIFARWRWRYLYPVYLGFVLSYLWSFAFVTRESWPQVAAWARAR
ncbi:hypothetical protein [Candidatus Desulforudis audaxviator]|nr:hypothetical protein [Candidatus Desulforudis audaxviator]AZK59846.1 hypothetical protein Daudx_1299 [Candidatus Desulforudis audaxviator]